MNIYEELNEVSEGERKRFLSLGVKASYPADTWLPDSRDGFFGIRIIQRGEVEVCAVREWRRTPIQRYGINESLGIRVLMRPDAEPKLAWRAVTDVSCLEFDGASIRTLIRQPGSTLRTILEHAAHMRDLDISIALHPLFRSLPLPGRQALLERAQPLALAPYESLPQTESKALYFVTQGSLRDKGDLKSNRKVGETIYTANGKAWISEAWTEALVFHNRELAAAAERFPLFAAQLKMER